MASSDSESDDSSVYSDLEREAAEEKSDEESEEKSDDESEGSAEEAFDADKEFERNDSSDEEVIRAKFKFSLSSCFLTYVKRILNLY